MFRGGVFGCGQRNVLAAGEVVVAEPVRGLGDPGQVLDRGVILPVGADPGLHGYYWRADRQFHGIACSSLHVSSGVDGDRLPGDGPALVAGQEQRQVGDILG